MTECNLSAHKKLVYVNDQYSFRSNANLFSNDLFQFVEKLVVVGVNHSTSLTISQECAPY